MKIENLPSQQTMSRLNGWPEGSCKGGACIVDERGENPQACSSHWHFAVFNHIHFLI